MKPEFVSSALRTAAISLGRPAPLAAFAEASTDSRTVPPGSLFVAILGETHDGHDHVVAALEKGAKAAVIRRGWKPPPGTVGWFYEVDDTLEAIRTLAAAWRKTFAIPVLAIAGSVGKTTTKECTRALLSGKWNEVLATSASQNGYLGVAITLLKLRSHHQAAIIEIGIDEIGAMAKHLEVVTPTHSIVTAIGPEHLEKLRDVPTVFAEERLALDWVRDHRGTVCLRTDDAWIAKAAADHPDAWRFALSGKGGARELAGEFDSQTRKLTIRGGGLPDGFFLMSPLPGNHNAINLLGAITMARALGLSAEQITRGLTAFQGAAGRSELRWLDERTPLLCDYYNANPTSIGAALEMLSDLKRPRSWVVLGDMLELGKEELRFHAELAPAVMQVRPTGVYLYGPRMRSLESALKQGGYSGTLLHANTHAEIAEALSKQFQRGDALLLKGSRGMRMEEVMKRLEGKL